MLFGIHFKEGNWGKSWSQPLSTTDWKNQKPAQRVGTVALGIFRALSYLTLIVPIGEAIGFAAHKAKVKSDKLGSSNSETEKTVKSIPTPIPSTLKSGLAIGKNISPKEIIGLLTNLNGMKIGEKQVSNDKKSSIERINDIPGAALLISESTKDQLYDIYKDTNHDNVFYANNKDMFFKIIVRSD